MEPGTADRIRAHMSMMRRCNTQQDAVDWMAGAYNLLDEMLREYESGASRTIYSIPGSYGERIYTMVSPEQSLVLPPVRRIAQPVWFEGRTVEYGDRYQDRAWPGVDERKFERENARRAAQGPLPRRRFVKKGR